MVLPSSTTLTPTDEELLLRAIALAQLAREHGNHPFGSLLADGTGQVLLEAENTVVTERDIAGHAELNLVRSAGMHLAADVLPGATLFTSTEPCAMCAGAIYWAGIGRVVYALGADQLTELVQGISDEPTLQLSCREVFARGGRVIEVSGPHLRERATAVHEGFWG
jgi:tRNA(Arg) A34 adenosine deaminase TadA